MQTTLAAVTGPLTKSSGRAAAIESPGKLARRWFLSGCLALVLALHLSPVAARGSDHDKAKRLRESGEILPLQEVLRRHRHTDRSRILDVELENRRGRYIYEVETLDKRGRVRRHYFDATTGKPLRSGERN